MIYEPIQFRRCLKCNEWYLATTEFFRVKDKGRRLDPWCRVCHTRYDKIWRENNIQKVKEASKRYAQKYPERMRQRRNNWTRKNPNKVRDNRQRDRQKFGERRNKYKELWSKAHPDKIRKYWHDREARKRQLIADLTDDDWKFALEYFHGVCAYCGNPPQLWDAPYLLHQEHHIPVTKRGGYTSSNIIPACKTCNSSKHDSDPDEWTVRRFGKRKATVILKRIREYFERVKNNHD